MSTSQTLAPSQNRSRPNAGWWTISNFLSLTRVLLLAPMLFFLHKNTPADNLVAFGFMLLGVATDWFDGYLARRFHQQSDIGRVMDPLSDKICIGGIALYVTLFRDFPKWFLILILARDFTILLIGFFITVRVKVPESNRPGKVAVTAMAVVLIVFAFDIKPVKWPFFWIMVVLFLASIASYVPRIWQLWKAKP
jgi:CDP-diacylglycerol--glycerol-3-phosphate 3-phosphatidyltransferase